MTQSLRLISLIILTIGLVGCDRETQYKLATVVPEIKKAQDRAEAESKAQAAAKAAEDAYRFSGSYGGVSLNAENPLVRRTRGKMAPAVPKTSEPGFGGAAPAHVLFTFGQNQQPYSLSPRDAQLRIFPVEAYRGTDPALARVIDDLKAMLAQQPVEFTSDIPVLPLINAAQIFRAQVRYLPFRNGMGVRFVTAYVDELTPITNENLVYIFQGLTIDGKFYVSLFYPLAAKALPDNAGYTLAAQDIDAFIKDFDRYLIDAVNTVERQPANQFTPDLSVLDNLVSSLQVAPNIVAPLPTPRIANNGEVMDTPTPPPSPEPTLGAWAARATVVLNVRAGPSLNDPVVTVLQPDEQVQLVARTADGAWFRLRTNYGLIGWAFARFIKPYVLIDKLPVIVIDATSTPLPLPRPTAAPTAVPSS